MCGFLCDWRVVLCGPYVVFPYSVTVVVFPISVTVNFFSHTRLYPLIPVDVFYSDHTHANRITLYSITPPITLWSFFQLGLRIIVLQYLPGGMEFEGVL